MNIYKKIKMDPQEKHNKSYDNYNKGNTCITEYGKNQGDINDNMSDKANSVQTSYKYRKNKGGQNSISSKYSNKNNVYNNIQNEEALSYEMSENDNLICPDCINCELIEDKHRREEYERNRMNDYNNNFDYTNGLYDKNRNYDRDMIEAKRRQRENNINEASQNLAKIKAELNEKEKLIQRNENSRNPLNDGRIDYRQKKFQDEYAKRQKMINDNLDKFYPNMSNERPQVKSYYDKYVYNPSYGRNDDYNNNYYNNNSNKNTINYGEFAPKNINREEYVKDLENQINYKNELKKREREEERRRGQKQFEDIQKELKREEEERYLKEKRQQEELRKANEELMNQKNKMKLKELEDKLKYKELYERQNEEYRKELEREKYERDRMKDDIYNHNKNEYENRQRKKDLEKEKEMYDNKRYYDNRYDNKYDNRYDNRNDNRYNDNYDNRGENIKDKRYDNKFDYRVGDKNYDDRYGDKGRDEDKDLCNINNNKNKIYDDRYGKKDGNKYNNREDNNREDNRDIGEHGKRKERMGRCCRCHKVFPRRLLTINRYFYKENRK